MIHEKVLKRFYIQNAKPISTLLTTHFSLSSVLSPQSDYEVDYMSQVLYSSAVVSLMHTIVCSPLDLSYAINKYIANLSKKHLKCPRVDSANFLSYDARGQCNAWARPRASNTRSGHY